MKRILLIPMGTPGDVQPFVEIGQALKARGHRVALVGYPQFASWAERYGLELLELGPAAQYQRLLDDPHLWNPARAHRVFAKKLVLPTLRPMYDLIAAERARDESLVVLAQTMALGARVAQEKLGTRTITLHRQPAVLRSVHDSPRVPVFALGPGVPRPLKRLQYRLMDTVVDHPLAPGLNAFRAELGLAPVRRITSDWLNSPDGVLCMWPDWFAAPQPDWPANLTLAGFDVQTGGEREPSAELVEFLESGEKPIVFTTGSGMKHGRAFYAESARACQLLGRRGLLVTRFAEQVPPDLPAGVIHVPYAPFNWLLPRCAAAVHHAGIGTMAQCLAAGVPQLCMPGIVFDTPDNARRAVRLGVARSIAGQRHRARRVAGLLRSLLDDGQVRQRCAELAARVRGNDAMGIVCAAIEQP